MTKLVNLFYILVFAYFQLSFTKPIHPPSASKFVHYNSLTLHQDRSQLEQFPQEFASNFSYISSETDREFASSQVRIKTNRKSNSTKSANKVNASRNKPKIEHSTRKESLKIKEQLKTRQQLQEHVRNKIKEAAPLSQTKIYYITLNKDQDVTEVETKKVLARQEYSDEYDSYYDDSGESGSIEETTEAATTTTTTTVASTTTENPTTTATTSSSNITYTNGYSGYGPSNGNDHISITYSPFDQNQYNYYNPLEHYLFPPFDSQDQFQHNSIVVQ